MPTARGGGREEQPHLQGAVAVRAQEGLEELFHVQGQVVWYSHVFQNFPQFIVIHTVKGTHPRSGAVAESARLRRRRNGGEELLCV